MAIPLEEGKGEQPVPGERPPSALARWYRASAVAVLSTVLVFVLINLVIEGYLTIRGTLFAEHRNPVSERHQKPVDEVYPGMRPHEIDELLRNTWKRAFQYESFTQFRERPYTSTYVNVSEFGFRLTKDQGPWPPRRDKHKTVFLFGGSTTFCYGLPDNQTLASHLQDVLRAENVDAKVYNFGRGHYFSLQERALFFKLIDAGAIPDVAIFVDGVNEFFVTDEPVFTGLLAQCGQQRAEEDTSAWGAWSRALLALPLGQLIQGPPAKRDDPRRLGAPDGVSVKLDDPALIEKVAQRYETNKKLIDAVAERFGVKTLFVWQPTPVYKYDLKYHLFAEEGFGTHARAQFGYPVMRHRAEEGAYGNNFLWCADIQESKKEALYVDLTHYTSAMSKEFALCIARGIKEKNCL